MLVIVCRYFKPKYANDYGLKQSGMRLCVVYVIELTHHSIEELRMLEKVSQVYTAFAFRKVWKLCTLFVSTNTGLEKVHSPFGTDGLS